MAVIEVNYQALRNMAQAIETYCAEQDKEMSRADASIKAMLSTDWIGPDALDFGGKWEAVDTSDATAVRFRESLQNYGEALKACASAYQTAQEDVYNLAQLLPR